MKRIILTTETPTGNLSIDQERFSRLINEFPLFDSEPRKNFPENISKVEKAFVEYKLQNPGFLVKDKPYTFKDNVSSNTESHGWWFEYRGQDYIALHVNMKRMSRAILFYKATPRGKFTVGTENIVKEYPMFVDIETAVEKFIIELDEAQKQLETQAD